MHMKESSSDLAGSQDLEHEWQAVRDQLLGVFLLLDAAEVFEQALDQRPAVLNEAGTQGLEPGVQRPGNAWEQQHTESEYTQHLSASRSESSRTDHVCITRWCKVRGGGVFGLVGSERVPVGIEKQHLNVIKEHPVKRNICTDMKDGCFGFSG